MVFSLPGDVDDPDEAPEVLSECLAHVEWFSEFTFLENDHGGA